MQEEHTSPNYSDNLGSGHYIIYAFSISKEVSLKLNEIAYGLITCNTQLWENNYSETPLHWQNKHKENNLENALHSVPPL